MSLLDSTIHSIPPLDEAAMAVARARQDRLTKPQGSLGRLEAVSIQVAGITGQPRPRIQMPVIIVMAADHGIARQGVSAYPPEVTGQMVLNFLRGGAAIDVMARHVGARVVVVDMGVASNIPPHPELICIRIAQGTHDMSQGPAMTRDQAIQALEAGIRIAQDQINHGADVIGTGDMGIGNTTASSAIAAVITGRPVAEVTGRGTGVSDAQLARKIALIEQTIRINTPRSDDALDVLSKVGGLEIAGLAGVILGAAARRVPVVIDGFISGAAALIATGLAPQARDYMIAAHMSVERGHPAILHHLGLTPLLDLDLRLGEGTGAALGISLVQVSLKILNEMATFDEAGVSEKVE
jgi:nicotinate-nucleotide--dimethylbenzimidazole phosphoribosyltransferase